MTRFTMTNDVTWGYGGSPRSFEVMTENQAGFDAYASKAGHALADATTLLDHAISALGKRPSSSIKKYAARYFLTDAKAPEEGDLRKINAILVLTCNGLTSGNFAVKIHNTTDDFAGKVRAKRSNGAPKPSTQSYHNTRTDLINGQDWRVGDVHITGDALSSGRYGVKTLIHEATHKYAGTDDYCYFTEDGRDPRSAFTEKARALKNADGYAWFALKVGRGGFLDSYRDYFNPMLSDP
jgi:hypothetical protein